ncbi:MAG TPA: site-specific DNA-methyltransferase [Streptosporangiaceae bacterium]|jgi:DNA modification methylase|nr:site-specific DNA-methyltransferase [Streptosporangiaceae bacterium]
MDTHTFASPPAPGLLGDAALEALLVQGITWGDSAEWLSALPEESVDLWFTSPPYADARAYSRIHPDRYVDWFLPFGKQMLAAARDTGWLVLNIKNRVADSGPLRGQRHPYVYQLVLALQRQGWRWVETYIWAKPNAVPGRYGPRTKDAFEYVYAFAKGLKPYFDLDAIRVPYRTTPGEIDRRRLDRLGRRNTDAGFGRDRTKTYLLGGADPGNVVSVPQTYNQHRGAGGHTAAMPEGLAEFFIKACSPPGGVVLDPFAGSGTTAVVARRLGRRVGGLEIHKSFVSAAQERLRRLDEPDGQPVLIQLAH